MKRILDEHLAAHPSCELCKVEDLDTPAVVAGLVEGSERGDVLRPVAVCQVHREMVEARPLPE
jgi:hypothetical protein